MPVIVGFHRSVYPAGSASIRLQPRRQSDLAGTPETLVCGSLQEPGSTVQCRAVASTALDSPKETAGSSQFLCRPKGEAP
jgi:hypothetical protein